MDQFVQKWIWKFVGSELVIQQDDNEFSDHSISYPYSALPTDDCLVICQSGCKRTFAESKVFFDDVLTQTFESCRYDSFTPTIRGLNKLENSDVTEGDCTQFSRSVMKLIEKTTSERTSFIVYSTAPPNFREPGFPVFSHVGVVSIVSDGVVLLDPAFLISKPIPLLQSTNFRYDYDWSIEDDPEFYSRTRGIIWSFEYDSNTKRINVYITYPETGRADHPVFYYILAEVTDLESISKQTSMFRRRVSYVRTDSLGRRLAHISVRLDTRKIEYMMNGMWSERPFTIDTNTTPGSVKAFLDDQGILHALKPKDILDLESKIICVVMACKNFNFINHSSLNNKLELVLKENYDLRWKLLQIPLFTLSDQYGLLVMKPWGKKLLSGEKIIETRKYPYPPELLGIAVDLIENVHEDDPPLYTSGNIVLPEHSPNFEITGKIRIVDCIIYRTREDWDVDYFRHRVPPDSPYSWSSEHAFYGWVCESVETYHPPRAIPEYHNAFRSIFIRKS